MGCNISSNKPKLNKQIKPEKTIAELQQHFLCPLTRELMSNPVLCQDGHIYERQAIEAHLKNNNKSPLTGKLLHNKDLTLIIPLRNAIIEYKKGLGIKVPWPFIIGAVTPTHYQNQWLDVKYKGYWYEARIVDLHESNGEVQISYWQDSWTEWIDFRDTLRIAPLHTHTQKCFTTQLKNVKLNDNINVCNPTNCWVKGKIIDQNTEHQMIQIELNVMPDNCLPSTALIWFPIDSWRVTKQTVPKFQPQQICPHVSTCKDYKHEHCTRFRHFCTNGQNCSEAKDIRHNRWRIH